MAEPKRVVIVGGGFAGLSCGRALRRAPVEVTLIDRRNFHLFQPLLYQVATGMLSPADISATLRTVFRKQRNAAVRMDTVTGVDLRERRVQLETGEVPYDVLVLAAGLETSYFGHAEWRREAPGLKSLEDALEVRRTFLTALERAEWEERPEERRRQLTFVVIGGGPTGVELAGALAEVTGEVLAHEYSHSGCRCSEIVLIEAGPTLLPGFPKSLQERARRDLERRGVEVRLECPVLEIGKEKIRTEEGWLEAGTILWAAGLEAPSWVRTLGLATDRRGRIEVLPDCSVPDHPDVFVIGDLAVFREPAPSVPGIAPAAIQMGRFVARAIRADLEGKPRGTFRYRDKGQLATIGSGAAVGRVFGRCFAGWPAWLLWALVHIAYLIEFRDRTAVLLQWAWTWVLRRRTVRLITRVVTG